MKLMVMKTMMYTSTIIFNLKTPMSMGVLLITQTVMCTMLISLISSTSWMAMIIFLMLIGGLLILFMYMSSIASNEKFSPNLMLFVLLIMMVSMPTETLTTETVSNNSFMNILTNESMSMTKIYNMKTMTITLMLFMYLLLCMIAVSKILKIYKGPLRSKYE